jgi:hypothetical protein
MIKKLFDQVFKNPIDKDQDGEAQLRNFETSPLRFEFEILLAEYKALRDQINLLTTSQQQVATLSITLLAALGAASQLINKQEISEMSGVIPIILLASCLSFSFFSLMIFWCDIRIAYSAGYINSVLRPRMQNILRTALNRIPEIWEWETASLRNLHSWRFMFLEGISTIGRYAISIVPSILLFFIYIIERKAYQQVSALENSLFVLSFIALLFSIISAIFVVILFSKLPSFAKR